MCDLILTHSDISRFAIATRNVMFVLRGLGAVVEDHLHLPPGPLHQALPLCGRSVGTSRLATPGRESLKDRTSYRLDHDVADTDTDKGTQSSLLCDLGENVSYYYYFLSLRCISMR